MTDWTEVKTAGRKTWLFRWRPLKRVTPSGKALFQCKVCHSLDTSPRRECSGSSACRDWKPEKNLETELANVREIYLGLPLEERSKFVLSVIEMALLTP